MADEAPSRPKADQAKFIVLTDVSQPRWPALLKERLKNSSFLLVKTFTDLDKAHDGIDEALKGIGVVDEVILALGSADVAKGAADVKAVWRLVEKAAYRVQMYQPEGKPPPQTTLCTPTPLGSKAGAGVNDRIGELAKLEREVALSVGTRYVDLFNPIKADIEGLVEADGVRLNDAGQKRVAELIAAVFADGKAPQAPSDVKIAGQKVTWTASPSQDLLGYEIHDVDDESTLLTTTVGTEATLPEGHDTCTVSARDVAGRVSAGAKPEK
jgi:hypothetical protein